MEVVSPTGAIECHQWNATTFHSQPFPFHGTRKQVTNILQHTTKYIFYQLDKKKKGIILIHSHQMAIVGLAVVIFFI